MAKKVVRLTESQLIEVVRDSVCSILNEDRNGRNLHKARRFARLYANAPTESQQWECINAIRKDIQFSRICDEKYMAGIIRLIYNDHIESREFWMINEILEAFNNNPKLISKFNSNFNDLPIQDILIAAKPTIELMKSQEQEQLSSISLIEQNYKIIYIPDYETALKFSDYTEWCINSYSFDFDTYLGHGETLYFCLKDGYENTPKCHGNNYPKDDYGLSMIAVAVSPMGKLIFSTSRWNETTIGGKTFSVSELSQIVGRNFYQVFVPHDKDN